MNIALVENAVKTALNAILTPPVMIGFDQSTEPAASQVSILGTAEPLTFNNKGKPNAFTVTIRAHSITHSVDDASGSTRQALRAAIDGWAATVTPSTLNVTGWQCDTVTAITAEETTAFGSEFIGVGTRFDLIYQAT